MHQAQQRAAAAGLRPVVAVLSQAGPLVYGSTAQLGLAKARWPGAGREQSGVLTTAMAPGIIGAAAGARVLTGGCLQLGTDGLPYAPFTTVLRDLVHEMGADGVAAMLPGSCSTGGGWRPGNPRGP